MSTSRERYEEFMRATGRGGELGSPTTTAPAGQPVTALAPTTTTPTTDAGARWTNRIRDANIAAQARLDAAANTQPAAPAPTTPVTPSPEPPEANTTPGSETIQGASATGYDPAARIAAIHAAAQNYRPPSAASTQGYTAVNQPVTANQLSSSQLTNIVGGDSPYIRQARQMGLLESHARGNLNSSAAAGSAQAAAIRAALPLAQQDASTYGSAAANYANATNRAGEFGAREQNISMLQANQQQDAANRFEASAQNLVNREGAQADNRVAEYGVSAINRAGEFYAGAQNVASIQNANNELALTLQSLRDDLSTYTSDLQRDTALDNLGLNLFNTAMNSGVFASTEMIEGYFNTVSGIFPELGIQLISQAAGEIPEGVVL